LFDLIGIVSSIGIIKNQNGGDSMGILSGNFSSDYFILNSFEI
jgi:hypothetical protein